MDLRKTFIKLYRCLIWQKNKALAKWYNLELLSLVDNALWICSLTARWWDSGGFSSELHYLFQSDFRLLSALVGGFDRINRVHSVKLLAGQHCRWCSRYYNTLCQTLSWIWWRQGIIPRKLYDNWYQAYYAKVYNTVGYRYPYRLSR